MGGGDQGTEVCVEVGSFEVYGACSVADFAIFDVVSRNANSWLSIVFAIPARLAAAWEYRGMARAIVDRMSDRCDPRSPFVAVARVMVS